MTPLSSAAALDVDQRSDRLAGERAREISRHQAIHDMDLFDELGARHEIEHRRLHRQAEVEADRENMPRAHARANADSYRLSALRPPLSMMACQIRCGVAGISM